MIIGERKTFEQARIDEFDRQAFLFWSVFCVSFLGSGFTAMLLELPLSVAIALFLTALLIGYGLLFYCRWLQRSKETYETSKYDRWIESTALVLKTETSVHSDGYGKRWIRYFLIIRFTFQHAEVDLRTRVDKSFYDLTQVGDTLVIRYQPDNPCVALLEGEAGFEALPGQGRQWDA